MFAGPNGSGKSTLKSYLPTALLGVYLNPDEMESEIRRQNFLDFIAYDVTTTADAGGHFSKIPNSSTPPDSARPPSN